MGDVVPFKGDQVFFAGPISCAECGHRWTGVSPSTVIEHECPKCGQMSGQRRKLIAGKDARQCDCGSLTFSLMVEGDAVCTECGATHVMAYFWAQIDDKET